MADLSKLDANKSNAKTHSKTSPVAALAKSPMPVHDLPIPDFVGQPLIEAIAALHAASTTAGVGGGLPYVVEDGAIGGPAVAPPFNGQHYVTDQSPPYSPNGVSVSVMHFAVEERCTTPMPTILPKVDGIPCDQGMAAIDAYKRVNQRPYPTWTEVLEVIRKLGYRKTCDMAIQIDECEDWTESADAPVAATAPASEENEN
jgi:hypothetical protein